MKDYTVIRNRYLRDDVPIRLGGLAANLRRVKSFTSHAGNRDAVESLLDESKFFIEWTAGDTAVDEAAELVGLQLQISRWQLNWPAIWADTARRNQVAEQAGTWSDRVLVLSGLLSS